MKILDFPLFFTKIGLKWGCICFRVKILSYPVYCIYMPSPYLPSLPSPYQLLCRAFVMERRWIVGNTYRVWVWMDDSDV